MKGAAKKPTCRCTITMAQGVKKPDRETEKPKIQLAVRDNIVVAPRPSMKKRLLVAQRVIFTLMKYLDDVDGGGVDMNKVNYRDVLDKECFSEDFVEKTGVKFYDKKLYNIDTDIAAQLDWFAIDGDIPFR